MRKLGWSKEANDSSKVGKIFLFVVFAIYAIILIINIIKIVRFSKLNKQKGDGIKHNKFEYYRDIPREKDSTPAEAAYLYYFNKKRLDTGSLQSKTVASTILDLVLKRIISLRVQGKNVYVKINEEPTNLKKDEMAVYKLLKNASANEKEFKLEDLNKYAKKKYTKYSEIINEVVNSARNSLYSLGLIDKVQERLYSKAESANVKTIIVKNIYIWLIITYILSFIPIFKMGLIKEMGIGVQGGFLKLLIMLCPLIGTALYSWKLQEKNYKKIAVLTQAGSDEKEQWKGLVKYMKNYSLLNEKKVPDLVIWEKYLVYATAFGIAEEVIKQMKANYPEVFVKEQWEDEKMMKEHPVIYFSMNPYYYEYEGNTLSPISRISNNTESAYNTSMSEIAAHTSSSGSGGGGGFSGGGGGRRRSAAGMGGR